MIKILEKEVWQQIGAAKFANDFHTIIKELVENSIDAGSTRIEIFFQNKEIKVIDNGCGMSQKDIEICTFPHSTSKFESINKIKTLGFRGEALYWISLISDLVIISKTQNQPAFTFYKGSSECTFANVGTTVILKNIFESSGRLKFLNMKQQYQKIKILMEKFAVCYPHIHFQLHLNNRFFNFFNVNINSLFSSEYSNIYYKENKFILEGKIFFYHKSKYYFYVNKRIVYDSRLISNISNAYKKITGRNYCPSFVLFLTCDESLVDVNINSSKTEVLINIEEFYALTENLCLNQKQHREYALQQTISEWKFIGQVWSYLIGIKDNNLFFFDHHACHERILFEALKNELFSKQILLLPIIIKITDDFHLAMDDLKKVCDFYISRDQIIITAIVSFIKMEHFENITLNQNFLSDFLHSYGCDCAVSSHSQIGEVQFFSLVNRLFQCDNYKFCNHGRPTFLCFSKEEFNYKFQK